MKAIQIVDLSGPDSALREADVEEPEGSHMLTPGSGVLVDVHAAGVSFPELLQTRGEYQLKPPLPFVPGSEVGGIVRSAPDGAGVSAGDRVAAFPMLGGFAEVAVSPEFLTFPDPRRAQLRSGGGADPQLPHRLVLAGHPRSVEGGGDRPHPRWRQGASAPPRSRSARASEHGPSGSSQLTRRSGSPTPPEPTRSSAPTAPGRTRRRSSPVAALTLSSIPSEATGSRTPSDHLLKRDGWWSSASRRARSRR